MIIVDENSLKQDNPIEEPKVVQMTIDTLPVGTVVVDDMAYSKVYLKTLADKNDAIYKGITEVINNMDKFSLIMRREYLKSIRIYFYKTSGTNIL